MLTLIINGQEEKVNIGCRTFIALDELLKLLAVKDDAINFNGERVRSQDFRKFTVNGGATLTLSKP